MMDVIPSEPPRALRRRAAAAKKVGQEPEEPKEFVVCTAPWGEYATFSTARKAKKFKRRHSREIAERFNY